MAKVVLSGYFGFGNAGDEAILHAMVKGLRHCRPGLDLAVLSADPQGTSRQLGVEGVNRWDPAAVNQTIKGSHLLLSGGGSLLQDVTGPRSLFYYLGVVKMAQRLGVPSAFYSQGIGPINRQWGRVLVRSVANRVDLITVRDPDSRDLLRQIGVTRPPVHLTADPVLGLEREDLDLAGGRDLLRQHNVSPDGGRPILGVSLRPWMSSTSFYPAVARALDGLVQAGWQAVFLSMHHPHDLQAARETARLMDQPSVVVEDRLTWPQLGGILAHCQLIMAMRLHALILGAVAGVPLAALSCDPKISSLVKETGQLCVDLDGLECQELAVNLEQAVAQRESFLETLSACLPGLKDRAGLANRLVLNLLPGTPAKNHS